MFRRACLIALLASAALCGQIAYDSVGGAVYGSGNVPWTHTASGSNRIVFVVCAESTASPITATYGGIAMSSLSPEYVMQPSTFIAEIFYLVAPPTGAKTVTCSQPGTQGFSISYNGVAGLDAIGAVPAYVAGTGFSVNVTTSHANAWAIGFVTQASGTSTFGGASLRATNTAYRGYPVVGVYDSAAPIVTPGLYSVTGTVPAAHEKFAISIAPGATAGTAIVRHRVVSR